MLITDVFEQNSGTFVIPVFQRNYDWGIEQCRRLLQDLEKLIPIRKRDASSEHFFGATVRKINNTSTGYETMIIDGQQRMVTTTLVLLVIRNLFQQREYAPSQEEEKNEDQEKIGDINRLLKERKTRKIRFHLSLRDNEAYVSLFNGENESFPNTHITKNYNCIFKHIKTSSFSLEDWLDAVYGLRIIDIRLDERESAQEIFESLNSTGLALSHSNMVKNFLLMDLNSADQKEFYEDYWLKAERLANNENGNMDDFLRDFLTMYNQKVCGKSAVYKEYREYAIGKNTSTLMKELLDSAKDWGRITGTLQDDRLISSNMAHLRQTNQNVIRPFLLSVARRYRNKEISYDEFNQILRIIESYLMRYLLSGEKGNGLNKIFGNLDRNILKYDETFDHYVDKLIYHLTHIEGDYRFRTNKEFGEELAQYRYRKNTDQKILVNILDRLENFDSKEGQDILSKVEDSTYSIEHIMPQTLDESWVTSLGSHYKQIHDQWINSLGNLTVTAYNSQYSNQSFDKKKNCPGGFASSGIRLNHFIAKQFQWGELEIKERLEWMISQLEQAFLYPKTDYQPPKVVHQSVGLDEMWRTEYYPINLYLNGTSFKPLKNMKNVMVLTVKELYVEHPTLIQEFAQQETNHFSTYAKNNQPEKIAEGVYLDTSMSNKTKWSFLKRIFEKTNTPLDYFKLEVGIRKK